MSKQPSWECLGSPVTSDDQFSPSNGFCSRSQNVIGHPLWGSPDGIGLMQPDRTTNGGYFVNGTYWSYAANMETANDVLNATNAGVYTQTLYSPTGFAMELMNGSSYVKAVVPMPGGTAEVWQASGGVQYYRHSDWLGSSRFASTASRTMYNDLAFAPFGETYAQAGSTGVTDISFAGNDENTVANLYDAQFREYGIQGRWPSPDPAGIAAANPANPQSWNRYAYVLNNPLRATDPSGMVMTKQSAVPGGLAECATDLGCILNWVASTGGGGGGGGGGFILGNDIFDAISGAPGTFLSISPFGTLSFGWDYTLWSITMNKIDTINSTVAAAQQNAQTEGDQNPYPNANVPTTYGWGVVVQDFGTSTVATGVIPDMLAAADYSQWLVSAMGPNPSLETINKYAGYMQVYQNMLYKSCMDVSWSFNINLDCKNSNQ